MFRLVFGAALGLTLWCAEPAGASTSASTPRPYLRATATPGVRSTALPTVAELYSLRARRRMASYLRRRLLEWREAGLERAAAVVERRLSVDALVPQAAPPDSKPAAKDDSAKH